MNKMKKKNRISKTDNHLALGRERENYIFKKYDAKIAPVRRFVYADHSSKCVNLLYISSIFILYEKNVMRNNSHTLLLRKICNGKMHKEAFYTCNFCIVVINFFTLNKVSSYIYVCVCV